MLRIFFISLIICFSYGKKVSLNDFVSVIGQPAQFRNMTFANMWDNVIRSIVSNDTTRQVSVDEAEQLGFLYRRFAMSTLFPCKNYSIPGSGTNINNLTPLDIKIIAALGDSLSAGLGIKARTVFGLLTENRGSVFSIGGQKTEQTLSNFLRFYNPDLNGFTTKNTFIRSKGAPLNYAVSGATSRDVYSQVERLIAALKKTDGIDMKNDWKLITLFIGNNDVCRSCEPWNAKDFTPLLFKQRLIAAINKLKAEVPRAFVSLVTMLDVFEVINLNIGLVCQAIHLYECPCVAYTNNVDKIVQVNNEFQDAVWDVVNEGDFETEDFIVVVHPFFQNTHLPRKDGIPDLSYFAPDCFHLSEKGQAAVSVSLWNSLFEPVGQKHNSWHVDEVLKCPSVENPYLATNRNSKPSQQKLK